MKEAYAVRRTVPPSAEIQAEIDRLLDKRLVDDPQKMLSELGRLGARLIIQRAVEEEFDTWLGRARYERKPVAGSGKRNGFRPPTRALVRMCATFQSDTRPSWSASRSFFPRPRATPCSRRRVRFLRPL